MKHDPTFQKRSIAFLGAQRKWRGPHFSGLRKWFDRVRTKQALRFLDARLLADIGIDTGDPLYPDRARRYSKDIGLWED